MAVLVDLEAVTVRRADRPLFERLSLTVSDGDRIGVVGINGTGKSTLLRVAAGLDQPDEGTVRRGRSSRIGYLPQEPELPAGRVRDTVVTGWEGDAALQRLGMGDLVDADTASLSGGQTKRVALAAVVAEPADLLILDEPTNHLDLAAVAWLEAQLAAFRGGVLIVTHDRHLLDRVSSRMVELDRGRNHVHEGGYASYLEARLEREERAASTEATRRNLARRELAWLRRGAPARTRKPQARIDAALRIVEGRPQAARRGELSLAFFGTPRLGDKVIEGAGVGFAYEQQRPILAGVDLALDPRERLGVVGANGTGKSTLLDLLAGRRLPTEGRVETGPTVLVGYYDQKGADLDPSARVRDLVAGPTRVPGTPEDVALMERFWFGGDLPWAPVGTLSGGERRRLQLLLVLANRPNVLLLDEPTNDLDLDTLRMVEELLDDWPGAVVAVSHDRTFLNRVTDRLVAVEGGTVRAVPGGVDGWIAAAAAASGAGRGGDRPIVAPPARGGASGPGPLENPTAAAGPAATVRRSPPSGRSRSTLGRLMRDVEKEMARLQRRRDQLTEVLAASSDYQETARVGTELSAVQAGLDEAEERWLALAEEGEQAR